MASFKARIFCSFWNLVNPADDVALTRLDISSWNEMSSTQHQIIHIGLDGGGTKTALTAIDDHKKTIASVTVWLFLRLVSVFVNNLSQVESTNSNSVGLEKAKATLQQGIKELLTQAHVAPEQGNNFKIIILGCADCYHANRRLIWDLFFRTDVLLSVGSIVLCMAGVDRPEDKTRVSGWVAEVLPKTHNVTIDNDAVAALASGKTSLLMKILFVLILFF